MNRRKALAFLLLLGLAFGLPVGAARKGWFVECAAGFAALDPGDLNARPEAQQQRLEFLYRDGYEALQRFSGGAFSYVLEEAEGSALRGLHGGFPMALRIGRVLGARVSLFAGLEFLGRQRTSWLRQTFRINDLRPDQVTVPGAYIVETGFPEYFLSARAWVPQLGVIVDVFRNRSWTGGVRMAVGPMFARVRTLESQHYRKTDADGYWQEWQQVVDMRGNGGGMTADAMARLELALSWRLGLQIEGGYALRRGSGFSGPGLYEYQYRDMNAARDPVKNRWQGEWRTQRMELQREWGRLAYALSGNDLGGAADAGSFRLDLSGWRLSLGLALAL